MQIKMVTASLLILNFHEPNKNLIPSSFIVSNVKSSVKSNTNAEQLQAIVLEAGKVHPSSLIAYFLVW